MSKKPASLTSDLLARKGEAGPSSVDPVSRVTLTPGRQPNLGGIGADEGPSPALYASAATERPDMYGSDEEERPSPPEPEIIYTPEDEGSGGRGRLIAGAFVGAALLAGVLVAFSLNETGTGTAPVLPEPAAEHETGTETETASSPAAEAPAEAAATGETAAAPVSEAADEAFADLREEQVPMAATEAVKEPAPESAPASIVPPASPAPEPAAPAAVAEVTRPAATAEPASGGAFVVQIMALRAEETARSAWEALQAKHGTILGGHALDIERADLGAKGIFYRVRAAGFDTKAAAQSACANLKAAGQDCIVKAR